MHYSPCFSIAHSYTCFILQSSIAACLKMPHGCNCSLPFTLSFPISFFSVSLNLCTERALIPLGLAAMMFLDSLDVLSASVFSLSYPTRADQAAEFVPKPFRLLTPSIYSIKSGWKKSMCHMELSPSFPFPKASLFSFHKSKSLLFPLPWWLHALNLQNSGGGQELEEMQIISYRALQRHRSYSGDLVWSERIQRCRQVTPPSPPPLHTHTIQGLLSAGWYSRLSWTQNHRIKGIFRWMGGTVSTWLLLLLLLFREMWCEG